MNWLATKIFFYLCNKEMKLEEQIAYAQSKLDENHIPSDVLEGISVVKRQKEKELQRVFSMKQFFLV